MMRRGRHLVPKREGLAPLMVYREIIPLSPSVARIFRDPQELFSGISVTMGVRRGFITSFLTKYNTRFQPAIYSARNCLAYRNYS